MIKSVEKNISPESETTMVFNIIEDLSGERQVTKVRRDDYGGSWG